MDENGKLLAKLNKEQKAEKALNNGGDMDNDLDDDEDNLNDLKNQLPLPEGVLQVNLGIPIIVVCSKADLLVRGDKS